MRRDLKQAMQELYSAVDALLLRQERVLIALDGRSCAGKTTLARELLARYEANIFHMDDFFLPAELRTAARYAEPGGNIHYERFLTEVLLPLRHGRDVMLRRFECSTMALSAPERITYRPLTIVEGTYSHHPALRDLYDLRAFLDIAKETQLARLCARNGQSGADMFIHRWIPLEERYFEGCAVRQHADLILDGAQTVLLEPLSACDTGAPKEEQP